MVTDLCQLLESGSSVCFYLGDRMVTDLCQPLGSRNSVCLCVFLLGRQNGDRFVSAQQKKIPPPRL